MSHFAAFCLMVFGIAFSNPVWLHAQSSDDSLRHLPAKTVEISAPRPADLPVIDARQVEIKPAVRLTEITGSTITSDVLRALSSSLDVRRYGPLGSIAIPSYRGLPAEYTIVYRDGIRLTSEQLGLTDLGQLSLHGISHVELIPSSSAVLLGGDAVGAAIDLVSQTADSTSLQIGSDQISYGEGFPEQSYYGQITAKPSPSFSILGGWSLDQSTGAFPFFQDAVHPTVLRENNDAILRSGNISAVWNASDQTLVHFIGNYFFANRGSPGAVITEGRGASSLTARLTDEQGLAAIKIDHDAEDWNGTLTLQYQNQYEAFNDRVQGFNDSAINILYGFQARANRKLNDWLSGYAGVDLLHTRLTGSSNVKPDGNSIIGRDRFGAYTAVSITPSELLQVTASLRPEYVSDLNEFDLLPQASIDYTPRSWLDFNAAYSKSAHAPTLNDLYYKLYGQPTLKPERADNWQATLAIQPHLWSIMPKLSATYFNARIENEIVWRPDILGTSAWYPYNIGVAGIHGWEIKAEGTLGLSPHAAVHLEEGYTFLTSQNLTPGDSNYGRELIYSTPHSSLTTIQIEHDKWGSIAAMLRYRDRKWTDAANVDTASRLPSVYLYTLTLATREFRLGQFGVHALFSIDNLTDEHYVEVLNYPMPGRTYKFSIQLKYF